jgi:hypothetical protein
MLTAADIEAIKAAILPELKAELREAVEDQISPDRRWIKGILAAARIAKIHKDELRTLLHEKKIHGYQTESGHWIIDRQSLDTYHQTRIDSRINADTALRNKILDFMEKNR